MTGRIGTDDVTDESVSDFCVIGVADLLHPRCTSVARCVDHLLASVLDAPVGHGHDAAFIHRAVRVTRDFERVGAGYVDDETLEAHFTFAAARVNALRIGSVG